MFFKASWKNGALGDYRQLVGSSLALVVFVESSFGDAAAVTPAAMEKFPQYSLYQKLWFLMLIFILSLVSLCLCVQFCSSCSSQRGCLLNKGITSSVCLYIHIGVYMWSIHINTHWSISQLSLVTIFHLTCDCAGGRVFPGLTHPLLTGFYSAVTIKTGNIWLQPTTEFALKWSNKKVFIPWWCISKTFEWNSDQD